jgi:hypothetical protein
LEAIDFLVDGVVGGAPYEVAVENGLSHLVSWIARFLSGDP